MFLHELDHINGQTMQHWRVSEGNIEILDYKKDKNPDLMTTVDFYKQKIEEMKEGHEDTFF